MCSVFEEIEKKGELRGEKRGERKMAAKMARKLLTAKTMSYAEIADVTELSIEEIKALDNEMGGAD